MEEKGDNIEIAPLEIYFKKSLINEQTFLSVSTTTYVRESNVEGLMSASWLEDTDKDFKLSNPWKTEADREVIMLWSRCRCSTCVI